MEWRWAVFIEGIRETEGEKAGLSEGARPEIMSWGDTFGCDTFVYDPGKQSASNLLKNANSNPSFKIVDNRSSEIST